MKVQEADFGAPEGLEDSFSISKLQTFAKCARKARLRYIEGVKENQAFFIKGRAVHYGQEQDNLAKLAGRALTLDQVMEAARAGLDAEIKNVGTPEARKIPVDYFVSEHRTQLAVFERTGERGRVRPIPGTVESMFQVDLNLPGQPKAWVTGYLDVISRGEDADGDTRFLVDYKNVKRPTSPGEAAQSLQFELYQMGGLTTGGKVLQFVGRGRQAATFKCTLISPSTEARRERLLAWLAETITAFRSALKTGSWPKCAPESYWCSEGACDYYRRCYPERVSGIGRLVQVEKIQAAGSMAAPDWRKLKGVQDGRQGE